MQRRDPAARVIVFDGICHVCSGWVRFLKRHRIDPPFQLIPMQSAAGKTLLVEYGIDPDDPSTFLVLDQGQQLTQSDAAIYVIAGIGADCGELLTRRGLFRSAGAMPSISCSHGIDIVGLGAAALATGPSRKCASSLSEASVTFVRGSAEGYSRRRGLRSSPPAVGRILRWSLSRPQRSIWTAPTFAAQLKALNPDLVIHCAGPFQGQDYRVALASMACDAHYIDIADGRDFVGRFVDAVGPGGKSGRALRGHGS